MPVLSCYKQINNIQYKDNIKAATGYDNFMSNQLQLALHNLPFNFGTDGAQIVYKLNNISQGVLTYSKANSLEDIT